MKLAILGNNDGPLRLVRNLPRGFQLVFLGLQKEPSRELEKLYQNEISSSTEFRSVFDEEKVFTYLKNHPVDLLINCFCNFKFTVLLEKYKVLNVHLSPLPKYRGRHPLHWALINGEKTFGVSIHKMNENFDAGEIYWQVQTKIQPKSSVQELREDLLLALEKEVPRFFSQLQEGKITPKVNSEKEATYVKRRYPQDSEITEWNDRELIVRKVYALAAEDFPAFLWINNQKVEVIQAEILSEKSGISSDFKVLRQSETELDVVSKMGSVIRFKRKR